MRVEITRRARRDIARILAHSEREFGFEARRRYEQLIAAGIGRLHLDAEPISARTMVRGGKNWRLFHLRQIPAGKSGVKEPRHFIIYRQEVDVRYVGAVLHDAMDLPAQMEGL